ncbi:hypothetical protein Ancab_004769 [Ancistrocladus abbreviatus]
MLVTNRMQGCSDVFVAWEEKIISQEKGNRMVHFFLKDSSGNAVLAVIGTERSVRHMIYVVSDKFVEDYGPMTFVNVGTKWRARREVIDWLTLLVSKNQSRLDLQAAGQMQPGGHLTSQSSTHVTPKANEMIHVCRKLKAQHSDIRWSGAAWACSKQLIHYPSFYRNGSTISVHSFVLIMAAEGSPYLGYIEDMYEDKRGQKKVKVRWFQHSEKVRGAFSELNAHPREVFITPHVQVICAECIDGPASVLTPKHYERCVAVSPESFLSRLHLCFRQLKHDRIKPFTLSKLHGYSNQAVLSCLDHPLFSKDKTKFHYFNEGKEQGIADRNPRLSGVKRNRSSNHQKQWASPLAFGSQITKCEPSYPKLKFKLAGRRLLDSKYVEPEPQFDAPYKVNDEIELLCQDSGIRGCWFRCKVLQISPKRLKVQYDDLPDPEESGNLEEWAPASRVAAPDKLGMRCSGRLVIRPRPPMDSTGCIPEVGVPVDAWWCDGWWEGIVTAVDASAEDCLQVYLPGEDRLITVGKKNIRISRDWLSGAWITIKRKPDILAYVAANTSLSGKLLKSSLLAEASGSVSSAILSQAAPLVSKLEVVAEDRQ